MPVVAAPPKVTYYTRYCCDSKARRVKKAYIYNIDRISCNYFVIYQLNSRACIMMCKYYNTHRLGSDAQAAKKHLSRAKRKRLVRALHTLHNERIAIL